MWFNHPRTGGRILLICLKTVAECSSNYLVRIPVYCSISLVTVAECGSITLHILKLYDKFTLLIVAESESVTLLTVGELFQSPY